MGPPKGEPTQQHTPHTIVVGGGLSGLIAAAHLARAGHPVTLLEASASLGGRASTDAVHGALLNRGAHAIYIAGGLMAEIDALGVVVDGGRPDRERFVDGGEALHTLPEGPRALLTTTALKGRERAAFAALLLAAIRQGAGGDPRLSVDTWLDGRGAVGRPRALVQALTRLVTYQTSATLSAGPAFAQLQIALKNVLSPHGGWSSLVERLTESPKDSALAFTRGPESTLSAGLDAPLDRRPRGPRLKRHAWSPQGAAHRKETTSPMATFAALLLIALLIAGFSLFGLTFSIAYYLVAGLVIGGLARLVLPGRENIGWLGTSLVGMAGSMGGGLIGRALHVGGGLQIVLAVIVSAVLLSVLGFRARR